MAPESITKRQFSEQSDVYSFGITLYEIFARIQPYSNMKIRSEKRIAFEDNIRPKITPNMDINKVGGLESLIQQCWHTKPKERPLFEEIIKRLERMFNNYSNSSLIMDHHHHHNHSHHKKLKPKSTPPRNNELNKKRQKHNEGFESVQTHESSSNEDQDMSLQNPSGLSGVEESMDEEKPNVLQRVWMKINQ